MSDDRKYRQRGYMDSDRDRQPAQRQGPKGPQGPRPERPDGPRTPNLMAARQVVRCARCGTEVTPPFGLESRCSKCGSDLHSCAQCTYFDPGARLQCMQPVTVRITPKDGRNSCEMWEPRATVERQTHSVSVSSARSAFDDLFK